RDHRARQGPDPEPGFDRDAVAGQPEPAERSLAAALSNRTLWRSQRPGARPHERRAFCVFTLSSFPRTREPRAAQHSANVFFTAGSRLRGDDELGSGKKTHTQKTIFLHAP